jgi:hypothetical protein
VTGQADPIGPARTITIRCDSPIVICTLLTDI